MSAVSLFSRAFIDGLKYACADHVDRLFADAGITNNMSDEERSRRISAEYKRREDLAAKQMAEAEVWRAIERGMRRED